MQVAFLGFGLIAGSIARALRTAPQPEWREAELSAWSPTGRGPAQAAAAGIVDLAAGDPATAVRAADIVVLGAPPLDVLELIDQLAGPLRDALPQGAVVTDVASTKAAIVARAERAGLRFVGGHPMAGREQTGYEAATADLFAGRPWVVVPPAAGASNASGLELVEDLARATGAVPIRMPAAEHDAATAAISHLPLLVAAALVEAIAGAGSGPGGERPGWSEASRLAAGGWRDMTRLARGDVAMGSGILATNAGLVAARLRSLRVVLDTWLGELEREGGPDPGKLADRLRAARERLEAGSNLD